jgi:hypothetical protein
MFDLEQSIADWRKQLDVAGIRTPALLEELENHLRGIVEELLRSGSNQQEAFDRAVERIGRIETIRNEFDKISPALPGELMKRIIIIGNGIAGILIGMALVMPALAQHQHTGAMTGESVVALIIGLVLTIGGAGSAWCGFKLREA